jgi:tetratricopeptide (TPR) repeat protein
MSSRLWLSLSVVLLALLCHLNSLGGTFHYDDSHSIVDNRHVRHLENIPRFFAEPGTFSSEPAMAMYRPVLLTTYAFNYALGKYRPGGYLLFNLLVHALCALLVLWTLEQLGLSRGLAWWGGAFFAVHPVHSQVVNYVSSRGEALAVLGVLAALCLAGQGKRLGGLMAYALGLLSKSAAVALLPLLALEAWRRRERQWWAAWPFWGITALYLLAITLNQFLPRSLAQDVRPYGAQLLTQLKALPYYAKLIFMPVHLSVEHAFEVSEHPAEGAVLGSALLLGSLLYLAWRGRRQPTWAILGLGWFLAGLGLTFLVPLNVLVNEHRLYLPSLGALLAILGGMRPSKQTRLAGVGALLLVVLAGLTWQRDREWKSEYSLWQSALRQAPGMFRVQSNLGLALYERGEYQAARALLEQAVQLNPHYSKTWNNLGLVYEELGRPAQAEGAYHQALKLKSDQVGTLANLGRLYLESGRHAEAQARLGQALELDPHSALVRVNLGLAHQRAGRLEEAVEQYRRALTSEPEAADAWNNLGLAYAELGRLEEGRSCLEKAVRLRPEYQEAQINLHLLEMRLQGRSGPEMYRELIRLYPQRAELWRELGQAQAQSGAWEEAAQAYERAVELDPRLTGAYIGLGGARRSLGDLEAAMASYQRGLVQAGEQVALYLNLASAQAAAGRLPEAMASCRRALEIEPHSERAARQLEVLQQAGAERGLTER